MGLKQADGPVNTHTHTHIHTHMHIKCGMWIGVGVYLGYYGITFHGEYLALI